MNGWKRWLPGLQILGRYESPWLRHDLMAGLVLATMLVPAGIAYAVASGVPGIYGLYATIVPMLAYALFGPSRILALGPDSSLAPVILAVVLPLSGGDPMRAVALASMMAVVSGLVCILVGIMRLGFVTEVVEPDELPAAAEAEARRYLNASPFALRRTKELVYGGMVRPVDEHLRETARLLEECFHSDDHREGVAAFLERGPAALTGR